MFSVRRFLYPMCGCVGGLVLCCLFWVRPVEAATFTVNSNIDDNDGVCTHPYVSAAADCTWREAINSANTTPGADTITFAIDPSFPDDGDGQWIITMDGATNPLTTPITVTAVNMWDVDDDRPGVKFKRTTSTQTLVNFTVSSAGSKVQGIEIEGSNVGVAATTANITIGTDCDGVNDARERNVIYGTAAEAIFLSSTGAHVRGNYIGVRADGRTINTFGAQGILITGAGADANTVGYEEGTSTVCSAAVQRNVIGGGDGAADNAIVIGSSSTTAIAGLAASAPDHNVVAGNYLGVGADGITDIGGVGGGVDITKAATLNFVGTDGDGIDDTLEGNVISGWSLSGVLIDGTGYNRIAGNVIGFLADGVSANGNGNHGVLLRGTGNIVGWCDAAISASLCFDSSDPAAQANVSGNNTDTGIRAGASCNDCRIAGNIVGTDARETVDAGNGSIGILIHRGDMRVVIGGDVAEAGNVVAYNGDHGIHVDGYFYGSPFTSGPTEDYLIKYNRVYNNTAGIHLYGTEQDGTVGGADGVVTENTVYNNDTFGISLEGSSPNVTNNTVRGNGTYGIQLQSSYREDEPTASGTHYQNPYDTLSPNNAGNDSVAEPLLTGNTIDSNLLGGIYMLDARASNFATLEEDNTIGDNGAFAIRQNWYAAVELIDRYGEVIGSDVQQLVFAPQEGACTGVCAGTTFASAGGEEGVWGPAGIVYDNATTWFSLTDYEIAANGDRRNFNPYTITYDATNRVSGSVQATIDGDGSNDSDSGYLPIGRDTVGVTRYQIPEVGGGRRPSLTPNVNLSAPLALTAVALSDTSVRWYFEDQSNGESGFRLVGLMDGTERVLQETSSDTGFIDENDLAPSTEYCDRYVYAFNDQGTSDYTLLPCVKTLAAGNVAEQSGIPRLTVTQVVSRLDTSILGLMGKTSGRLLGIFLPFGGVVSLGILKTQRAHRKGKRHGRVMGGFFLLACISAAAVLFFARFNDCPTAKACGGVSLAADDVLKQYDELQFDFHLTNTGEVAARGLVLTDLLSSALHVRAQSLAAHLDGQPVEVSASMNGQLLSAELGDLAPGETLEVYFAGRVEVADGVLENQAFVEGENLFKTASNTVTFSIDTPPPQLPAPVGSVIKIKDEATLYYVDDDSTRRPFRNEKIFLTWFDASQPITILSSAQMASVPLGREMTVRPGTVLVKVPYEATVYAVVPEGPALRALPSETRAEQLYGPDWATMVIDISDTERVDYILGSPLGSYDVPTGELITDETTLCYVDNNSCRVVSPAGKRLNRFLDAYVRHPTSGIFHQLRLSDMPIGSHIDALTNPE